MVAAEAAACGALPVSAQHSGLAEVSRVLAAALPEPARPWLSFPLGDKAVDGIAARLVAWLEAPDTLRRSAREALVATAREHYSWEGVARGVLAAAQGRLDALPPP
jgi:glycosyltransferase involved in cell wall biosynthesis